MKWPWIEKKIAILPPLEGYDLWASTYQQASNPVKNSSAELIEKMLPALEGKSILDAGCGPGSFCRLAEERGASRIVGIDLSPAMIEEAKGNCTRSELLCAPLSAVVLEVQSFDLIVCALVLGHIEDLGAVLDKLLPSLKKDGLILITDFHPFLTLDNKRRTFQDPRTNRTFEVRHYLHLFQDYIQCFHRHQVVVEQMEEPVWNNLPITFGLKGRKT